MFEGIGQKSKSDSGRSALLNYMSLTTENLKDDSKKLSNFMVFSELGKRPFQDPRVASSRPFKIPKYEKDQDSES